MLNKVRLRNLSVAFKVANTIPPPAHRLIDSHINALFSIVDTALNNPEFFDRWCSALAAFCESELELRSLEKMFSHDSKGGN